MQWDYALARFLSVSRVSSVVDDHMLTFGLHISQAQVYYSIVEGVERDGEREYGDADTSPLH